MSDFLSFFLYFRTPIPFWFSQHTEPNLTAVLHVVVTQLYALLFFLLSLPSLLDYLNLGRNGITHNIPTQLGLLTKLEILDLSTNEISGEIPPVVLTQLTHLREYSSIPCFVASFSSIPHLVLLPFNSIVLAIHDTASRFFPFCDTCHSTFYDCSVLF